jgi:NADH-quinone oxidoreductase subunit H
MAPVLTFLLSMVGWAVIPFAPGWAVSNINVGVLYLFAISSLGVYGIIMGGWASNSKYPFLGSLRSAAQMVSYEVSIGFVIITVILLSGSMNLSTIVEKQAGGFWNWNVLGGGLHNWPIAIVMFAMSVIFFISALAETNRPPFDLPEAESELVAGYQVEYSSSPFLLFMIGELVNIVLMCSLISLLFFGGWQAPIDFAFVHQWGPMAQGFYGLMWFFLKTCFFFFLIAMAKAIVPRYRYDQLMRLGWKVFLPMSLVAVVVVAGWRVFGPRA